MRFLRAKGCYIGKGTRFFDPRGTEIDLTKPSLVTIGENVQITAGVKILTHGFDWFVLNGIYGDVLGSAGMVTIGNNVFIGNNAIILKGVTIGDNTIIGAAALVNKDVPAGSVVAGNPARIITTIDQYYKKRKAAQLDEAFILYDSYKQRYGKIPDKSYFHEFFWLFEYSSDGCFEIDKFNYEMHIGGRFEKTKKKYLSSKRKFLGYDEFCRFCEKRIQT